MEKIMVGLWNKKVEFFENETMILFYSDEQAQAVLSRSLRDGYVNGEITKDWLKEHQYKEVGVFDSLSGKVSQHEGEPMYVYLLIDCYQVCADLIRKSDNDDA